MLFSLQSFSHFYNWDRDYEDEPATYIHIEKKKIGSSEWVKFQRCPCQMIHNDTEQVTSKPYDRNFCWSVDKNNACMNMKKYCTDVIGDVYLSRSSLQTLIVGAKGDQYLKAATDLALMAGAYKVYKYAAAKTSYYIMKVLIGTGVFAAENELSNYLFRSSNEDKVKKELLDTFDYYVYREGVDDPFFDHTLLDYWKHYTDENEKTTWQRTKEIFRPIADSWKQQGKNIIKLRGIDDDKRFGNKFTDHRTIESIEEAIKLIFYKLTWKPNTGKYSNYYGLELSDTAAKRRGLPSNYYRYGE